MVTYEDLLNLTKKSLSTYSFTEEELISFVKAGAVRAYKAGDESRKKENVVADFNPETKELRLSVEKLVVAEVKDSQLECAAGDGKQVGETATFPITDADTYKAIDAAIDGMRQVIDSRWKKENSDFIKVKFQEIQGHCVLAKIQNGKLSPIPVTVGGIEAVLPLDEQIPAEALSDNKEVMVFVKEMRELGDGNEIVVTRRHESLVSNAMRKFIPEVELGAVEIKAVSRIPGKWSRAAVFSENMNAVDRCEKRAGQIAEELGGETVDFVEWYDDSKAFIVSSLRAEARDVHLIESEKQSLVEVFKDSIDNNSDNENLNIKLAQSLTGYKIEIKLVGKDPASELPGV
jgi:transcription termination/antitermination protein NusA